MSSTGDVRRFGLYLALIPLGLLIGEIIGRLLGIGSGGMMVAGIVLLGGLMVSFGARLVRGAFTGRS